jgi:hypothetical protein
MWLGYVLFSFPFTGNVVLECPIEGNATYVLSGNWEALVNHTKHDLREWFPDSYARIFHQGNWLGRVENALCSTIGTGG